MNIFVLILSHFFLFVKGGYQFARQSFKKGLQREAQVFKKLKSFFGERIDSIVNYLCNSLTILLSTLLGELIRELVEEMSDQQYDPLFDRLEDRLWDRLESKLIDEVNSEVDSYVTSAIERWDAWGNANETLQGMIADVLLEKEALIEQTIQEQIAQKLETKAEAVELPVEMFPLG